MTPSLRRTIWYRHLPFLMLLILGAMVRFYGLSERTWDSDELGALFRAQEAADFAAHVNQGVSIDGHPALVQTFLWYNEQVWKSSPLQLKYIWGVLSLVSICFFYGYFWIRAGRKVALITSSLLLLLWWPVSMSIWVRPYTIAFLWLSILVFSSAKMLQTKTLKHIWLIIAGLSLALVAYSHYMAALTAIFFLFGEFYLRKLQLKQIAIISIIAGVLFLPHSELFFKQFQEGGLSWLGKPSLDFFGKHLYFILNGSNLLLAFITLLFLFGIFWYRMKPISVERLKFAVTQIGMWLGVFLVTYFYSIWRKPVLQNNALYFALPFLIGGISVFTYRFPSMLMRSIQIIMVGLLCYSLAIEKQFYGLASIDRYAQPFNWFQKHPTDEPKYLEGPKDVLTFHGNLQNPPSNFTWLPPEPTADWINRFSKLSEDTVWIGFHAGTSMQWQTYFWSHFQFIVEPSYRSKRYLFPGGELFRAVHSNHTYLSEQLAYEFDLEGDKPMMIPFSTISGKLGSIQATDYLVFSVETDKKELQKTSYHLVSALFQEGFNKALHQIDYRHSTNQSEWNKTTDSMSNVVETHHPIKLADIPHWDEHSLLRVSFENRDTQPVGTPFKVRGKIRKISGNPFLYELPTKQSLF